MNYFVDFVIYDDWIVVWVQRKGRVFLLFYQLISVLLVMLTVQQAFRLSFQRNKKKKI